MEKKQKKGMKKLVISMVAMMLAIVGAATSTYAWFTMTSAPQVGEFQVKVATVSGLEIALDTREYDTAAGANKPTLTVPYTALNYKTIITGEEIESQIKSMFATDLENATSQLTLAPAQSADGKTFMDLSGTTLATSAQADHSKIGRFVGAEGVNQVGFLEFSLYFRVKNADYAVSGSPKNVRLDMTNYTLNGADNHRDGTDDVRTYVKSEAAGAQTYVLPTTWDSVTMGKLSGPNAPAGFSYIGTSADEAYIIVDNASRAIVGINVYKYLSKTSASTLSSDNRTMFVDPATGKFMQWNDDVITLATALVAADDASSNTHYNDGAPNNNATSGVKLSGNGANALRLSFAEIPAANFADKLVEETAKMWDPRSGLGLFEANADNENFALHMLWASGRTTTGNESAADDARYEKGRTASTIGAADIVTLNTVNENGYHYGATTVRIWVDGWDAECFNGIMAGIANIGFQFKLA